MVAQADAAFEKMLTHSYTIDSDSVDYHNNGASIASVSYIYCKMAHDLFLSYGIQELIDKFKLKMLISTQLHNMHLNHELPSQL